MAMSKSGTTADDRRTINMIGRTAVSQIAQRGPHFGDVYRGTFHGIKIFILVILPNDIDISKTPFTNGIDTLRAKLWTQCENTVREI